VIVYAFDPFLSGTMRAAEISCFGFDAVTDYSTAAVGTNRRQLVNRALETIENVTVSRCNHFKCQIIIVAANFALCHRFSAPLPEITSIYH
jgi:hypothetical protein